MPVVEEEKPVIVKPFAKAEGLKQTIDARHDGLAKDLRGISDTIHALAGHVKESFPEEDRLAHKHEPLIRSALGEFVNSTRDSLKALEDAVELAA